MYRIVIERIIKIKERHIHYVEGAWDESEAIDKVLYEEPEPDYIEEVNDGYYDYSHETPKIISVEEVEHE